MEQFKENYQNQNERMNPQLENMLKSMQSDLANNPAFPKTDANGNPINFVELIAYKRFLDVIEKVKRYTNLQNVTGGGLGQLSSMMMQGVQFIQQVEAPHKQELENLAVDLVVEEMEIPDGAFQFQCKLVPVGSINQDGFQKDAQEPNEEEINQAFENESQNVEIPADELFEDEKHKRRFINMLIQGSSKKGHYMFELVRRKVNEYNPNLAETYGKVMSINDLIYWLLDDQTIKQMASSSSSMAGKEEIEEGEDGDTIIKTEAICFPVSLHEIIKGVMEVFGSQGLPDDPQQATLVIDAVDSLSNETMDLRLGVPCWEKIYGAYPDFILEEGNRYLQSYLFARYCALPTDEFFRVSRLILSDDPKGAKYFAKMVDEIQNDLQQEDYQKNIDDINLDDLLGFDMGGRIGKWKKSKTMIFPTKEEAEKRLAFLKNYDSLRNIKMKKLENGYVIFFEHLVIDDAYGKDTTQYRIRKLKLNQNRGFEGYKLPDDFKKGGGVEKGYNVFNYTDNVYATDEVFKTKKLANEFIKEFRNRFSRQGYYRDNQMNKIAIEDIDLLAIPTDFSPFRKFNGGGGVGDELPYPYQMQWEKLLNDFGKDKVMRMFPSGANGYYTSRTKGNYSDDAIRQSLKSMFEEGGGVNVGKYIVTAYDGKSAEFSLNKKGLKAKNKTDVAYFNLDQANRFIEKHKSKYLNVSKHLIRERTFNDDVADYDDFVDRETYLKLKQQGRKFNGGGGVNSNYGKFGDDNSNLVNFDIDNLDAFEFRQYENFSKSLSKAQALQVLINDVEGDYSQLSEELSKIAEEQMPMDNYNNGGMIDLFEDYENIPANVKSILDYYELEESDYDTLNDLQNELADVGYTFDFGLDYQPYGLRPIGVKITELQGYEDFDDSDKFDGGGEIQIGDEVEFSVPYFENELFYKGKIIELKGRYAVVEYQSDNDRILRTNLDLSKLKKAKFNGGGEAEFDVYNWDDKMALINLGQIYEYAIELDKIIDENTQLEEWVKMKLTRIEQNIADVKHSLEGWEKYSSGGEIAKKQLLHIAKYSKDLIEMISNGSKLMSWQEGKLSVSAQSIDDIYHHLDYKMGNRAVDLENESEDKFVDGGGVGEFPPKGELTNKDNFLLKYEKKGGEYEFFVYKPITKEVSGYNQIKHVCLNKDCPQKMNYEQFINYLYAELYLDDTQYTGGGEVQGWMKEALLNLQLVEDDNSLQITHTNEDSFYVEGDSAEYRVFETYAIAYDTAIEQVREDLEENPDYFNQDWLMNWVDVDDTIENILEEYYRSYADDIAFEDDSRYNNRLIAEMVANGLMTEEEATSEDADDIAEDNVDNLVDLYVEENMEGDKGVEWYISNFGQDDFRDLVIDNNLIDISGASEDAVDTDGVAHFLSSYDGEEIELDNDVVAYRTN